MRQLLIVVALSIGPAMLVRADDNAAALAKKAVDAERAGDFRTAISAFEDLIHSGTDTPDVRSNLGIAYFQMGQYSSAVDQFHTALANKPDSLPANLFSGLSFLKLGRPKEAVPYLQKAHRLREADPQIVLALAQASLGAKDVRESRDDYKQVTQLQPNNAEAWYGLGITDRVLAETEAKAWKGAGANAAALQETRALLRDSEQAIARAVKLDPSSVRSHMIFGEALRIAERYPEAVAEYEAATKQASDMAVAWAGLATAYSATGDDNKALQAGQRALQLDPQDASTNALIAGTYIRLGDPTNAEPYAKRALELQPNLSTAHVDLAKVYLARHEPEKAAPELQAAAPEDTDGTIHYLLATTLRQLGKNSEAAAAMQQYRHLHASVTASR